MFSYPTFICLDTARLIFLNHSPIFSKFKRQSVASSMTNKTHKCKCHVIALRLKFPCHFFLFHKPRGRIIWVHCPISHHQHLVNYWIWWERCVWRNWFTIFWFESICTIPFEWAIIHPDRCIYSFNYLRFLQFFGCLSNFSRFLYE